MMWGWLNLTDPETIFVFGGSLTISGLPWCSPRILYVFQVFLCLKISPTLGFVWSLLMVIPFLPLEVENSTGLWFGIGLSVLWILGKQLQTRKAWMAVDLANQLWYQTANYLISNWYLVSPGCQHVSSVSTVKQRCDIDISTTNIFQHRSNSTAKTLPKKHTHDRYLHVPWTGPLQKCLFSQTLCEYIILPNKLESCQVSWI